MELIFGFNFDTICEKRYQVAKNKKRVKIHFYKIEIDSTLFNHKDNKYEKLLEELKKTNKKNIYLI
jgi:hypothetical protein